MKRPDPALKEMSGKADGFSWTATYYELEKFALAEVTASRGGRVVSARHGSGSFATEAEARGAAARMARDLILGGDYSVGVVQCECSLETLANAIQDIRDGSGGSLTANYLEPKPEKYPRHFHLRMRGVRYPDQLDRAHLMGAALEVLAKAGIAAYVRVDPNGP